MRSTLKQQLQQGPASLYGTRWWGTSCLNTRLTSKVKAINNGAIMVGQINDYVSTNPPQSDTMSWPKAVAWMPDGTCFMLDEIVNLPANTWFTDAVAINDDNIVVATLKTPSGLQAVALRLPVIP